MNTRTIPYNDYRERVFGCWLGKSIGGTLGGPWEGRTPPKELTFYDPVPTAMLENDDLDLQLVWLARIREAGLPMTGTMFARGWRENIHAWPDEYGVCIRNLDQGLMPPLTGSYDNGFTAGMGAAIRTELWACIAPGDPELASYLARQDAMCDHADEGVHAAVFLATVESLAFIEHDRDVLIDAGLAAIPNCRVARAVRAAREAWVRTKDRAGAFAELDRSHGNENFTDVAINLGIIVLGWCAGEGDFGKSILAAVNCGYDADCTCATLGAILGLIDPNGIDERWKKPIGESISVGAYIAGIRPPATLAELTDMTALLAEDVLTCYASPITLAEVPRKAAPTVRRYPDTAARALRTITIPERTSVIRDYPLHVTLTYPEGIRIAPDSPGRFSLVLRNMMDEKHTVSAILIPPQGWKLDGMTEIHVTLTPGADTRMEFTALPEEAAWRPNTSSLKIVYTLNGCPVELSAGLLMTIPFAFWTTDSVTDAEPARSANAHVMETRSHYPDMPANIGKDEFLIMQTECKMNMKMIRRFVVQAPSGTTAWINGEKVIAHDGSHHVSALHRARNTYADVNAATPVRITIAAQGGKPGTIFHAIGELGNCCHWTSLVEYRNMMRR
ncbi:MAG: ADP-ribosylglycohydrolase family protein [Spirochaetota bacterium]